MATLLIQKNAYDRMESRIRSICPDVQAVVMDNRGDLFLHEKQVEIEDIKPDMAWLSFELLVLNLMQKFADLILRAGSVQWMQTFNAGLERPFYRDIFKSGTRITKSDAQAIAIAEYVIANVMISFQRPFERKLLQDARRWEKTSFRELWQSRWLIVGFGNIGQQIAARLKGFDCHVTGVRRSPKSHPDADAMITPHQLAENLPRADVVVLACALNESTRGMANRSFFQGMKPGSVFVNIARGALVDYEALAAAMQVQAPQFAVLDVFDPEPLPKESPLWTLTNTIITSHCSYAGSGTGRRNDQLFVENLKRFLANEPLLNEISGEKDL